MSLSLPEQFGKYLLLDRIATGGMAEVFKAKITRDHGFEKIVIIKRLFSHLQAQSELVESFIDEAKIAAHLHHENIVQIYDFGSVGDAYFIAMEFLAGNNLKSILEASGKNNPLDLEISLYIMSRLCAGMHYAHNLKDFHGNPLNIVHRDVSPPNIMITDEGQVKIIDFGIAKTASQNTATRVGIIKGKVAYMSPEQADGKPLDHRSDIFALGSLLYEMVTGFPVYDGETMTILAKARKALFKSPEQIRPDLPGAVTAIISRALEKDVDLRYPSAGAMMDDIEACIIDLGFHPSGPRVSHVIRERLDRGRAVRPTPERSDGEPVSRECTPPEPTQDAEARFDLTGEYAPTAVLSVDNFWQKWKKPLVAAGLAILGMIVFFSFSMMNDAPLEPPDRPAPGTPSRIREQASEAAPGPEAFPESFGITAFKEKRYRDAIAEFERIFTEKPETEQVLKLPYMEALLAAASESADQDAGMAEILLLKAVKADPATLQAWFQLGLIYAKRAAYDKAIQAYKRAIELDGRSADAFFNLGYVYAMEKDYRNAETMYQKAVDLRPPYLDEALFNLSVVQNRQDKNEDAMRNLTQALRVNPGNTMAQAFLERLNIPPEENQ